MLSRLEAAGLRPGQRVLVRRVDGEVHISGPQASDAVVSDVVADHVYVAATDPVAHPVSATG